VRRFVVDCPARETLPRSRASSAMTGTSRLQFAFVLPRDRGASAHDFSTKFGGALTTSPSNSPEKGEGPWLHSHADLPPPGSQAKDPQKPMAPSHIEGPPRASPNRQALKSTVFNVGRRLSSRRIYEFSKAPEPRGPIFRVIEICPPTSNFAGLPLPEGWSANPAVGLWVRHLHVRLLTCIKARPCSDGDDIFQSMTASYGRP